jgi:phage terminase small subunit
VALTPKQAKFVAAYEGNGAEAARKAGYKAKRLDQAAYEILRNPEVAAAIQARSKSEASSLVADRAERQRFWTEVLRDGSQELRDRLKASELLGKSQADFLDRVEHQGGVVINVLDPYAAPPEKPK